MSSMHFANLLFHMSHLHFANFFMIIPELQHTYFNRWIQLAQPASAAANDHQILQARRRYEQ